MKRITLICILFVFVLTQFSIAQLMFQVEHPSEAVSLITSSGKIYGTLTVPTNNLTSSVALIIAGSGPTDRNGNNPQMTNNSLKFLSEFLADKGIASLRYDKRGIAESKGAMKQENDIRFEHYVEDASHWITRLKADDRFKKIIVIGHSEGSLIGMLACKAENADLFISIAGPGRSADKILNEQLKKQSPSLQKLAQPIIESLKKGEEVAKMPPSLQTLFRPSVQPYLISWFKYDPGVEIAKLAIPLAIFQGTTDIQVEISEAQILTSKAKRGSLHLIDGMNHILKKAPADRNANLRTYSQATLPLHPDFCTQLLQFIETN